MRFRAGNAGAGHTTDLDSNTEFREEYPWPLPSTIHGDIGRMRRAVIDCNHAVTVAHCVKSLPDEISVRLGDWDAGSTTELYELDLLRGGHFLHERFYQAAHHNDIA